jgi:hypothetical protein
VIPFASLEEYLPLGDLLRILVVCVSVAVIAPSAAALVITGFEAQANAHQAGRNRLPGDLRIAIGVAVLAAMIAAGIYALAKR